MQAASASQLFQSDTSLAIGRERAAKAERTASGGEHGYPIWIGTHSSPLPGTTAASPDAPPPDVRALAAKAAGADGGLAKAITAHLASPGDRCIWTAESGRLARATDIESGECVQQLRGHSAPVSALASLQVGERLLLFTASWDKSIRVWAAGTEKRPAPLVVVPDAASDFIKALHVDVAHACLVSGGSDKVVRVWDIALLRAWAEQQTADSWASPRGCPAPRVVGTVRAHTRPVLSLASLPPAPPDAPAADDVPTECTIFSGDSMGRILQISIAWRAGREAQCEIVRELDGPETGVLHIAPLWRMDDDDTQYTADVWTTSADKSVRRFPLSARTRRGVAPGRVSHAGATHGTLSSLRADVVLPLRDAAKAVLPLSQLGSVYSDLLLVGHDDGDVDVWRVATPPELVRVLDGHWHEVTFLDAWRRADGTLWILSASLDGTIRRWPLAEVLRPPAPSSAPVPSLLTAEEEAELAELMDE